jgi:rhodanese-related sulfurtransferase
MKKVIEGIRQVNAKELKEILEKLETNKIKLIDVREPHEYAAGHIPGVPLIPMTTIPEKMTELNKEDEFIFICRSGNRSQLVARYLKANGFENVINFYGGMLSWDGPVKQGMEE